MPNRILRDWTDSEKFDGLSAEAERLFVRLLMKADDFGRFHAKPKLVKSACFPLAEDLRANTISAWLTELSDRRLVFSYTSGTGEYVAIVNFRQRLKQSRAKFPPAPGKPNNWLPDESEFRELPGTSRNFPPESESDIESNLESESNTESDTDFDKTPQTPLEKTQIESSANFSGNQRQKAGNAKEGFLLRVWREAGLDEVEYQKRLSPLMALPELTPDDEHCLGLGGIDLRDRKKEIFCRKAKALLGDQSFSEEAHMLKSRVIEGAVDNPEAYFNTLISKAIKDISNG